MRTSDLIQVMLVAAFILVILGLFIKAVPPGNDEYMKQALAALFGFIGGVGTTGLLMSGNTKTETTKEGEEK